MLVLTKRQTTVESAEIYLRGVPSNKADMVKEAIEKMLDLAGMDFRNSEEEAQGLYTIEEVFPEFHVGHALRGLRSREGLTQKRLAEMIGIKPNHISEMENGKRPIGKEMAKRLGKALRTGYRVFL